MTPDDEVQEIRLGDTAGSQRRVADHPEAGFELAFAWFPPDEWPKATERWPELLEDKPAEPVEYSHAIEGAIKQYVALAPGSSMHAAPMTVDELVTYSQDKGEDPSTGDARARFAAELLRVGQAIPWPPGRNEPCWCRSGRKYKQCCGPIPPTALPTASD